MSHNYLVFNSSGLDISTTKNPSPVMAQYKLVEYVNLNAENNQLVAFNSPPLYSNGVDSNYITYDPILKQFTVLKDCTLRFDFTINGNSNGVRLFLAFYMYKNGVYFCDFTMEFSSISGLFVESFVTNDVITIRNVRGLGTGPIFSGSNDILEVTLLSP